MPSPVPTVQEHEQASRPAAPSPASSVRAGSRPHTLLVDYAGVLTNPLPQIYRAFADSCGLTVEEVAQVMVRAALRSRRPPLELLEIGAITERQFLELVQTAVEEELPERAVHLGAFRRQWFGAIRPNEEMVQFLRVLSDGGHRLALVTNNVREWRDDWTSGVPLELFDVVVDSSEEGVRKPDEELFRRVLARLGAAPEECLLVDDVWDNCAAARRLDLHVVWFQSTEQAVHEITRTLGTVEPVAPVPVPRRSARA